MADAPTSPVTGETQYSQVRVELEAKRLLQAACDRLKREKDVSKLSLSDAIRLLSAAKLAE